VKRLPVALLLTASITAGCSAANEPSPSPTSTATPAPSAAAPAGKRRPVVLDAKKLVLAVDDMTTNDLTFGETDAATAKRELDERLGSVAVERDFTASDCGAGPQRSLTYGGLSVYFLDDKLAGWSVRSDDTSGLTTATGISLASTREQVQDVYDGKVKVFESSLGTEWTAPDGISGLFKDDSPDAVVATFWSGTTCIAR
jgi:hypothetical protein